MPEIADETVTAVCYPPESLYEQWDSHASQLDQTTSRFMIRMVETGRKEININNASTSSVREALQERANLKRELQQKRERIKDLERQLEFTPHSEITSFVTENPGVPTPEIMQHVADTVPNRVAGHLDMLEGSVIEYRDDGYYPLSGE
jgi:predicted RNase H-like nuclease (RuvC/YqgF family)